MFLLDWFYGILTSLGLWQKEAKILFLGLDNAGKSTLLDVLRDERLVRHQPTQYPTSGETQYPTSGEFSIGKIKFKAFGLGGHQIVRRVLKDYYFRVDAVVYIFDFYGLRSLNEKRTELHALLSVESLANVPFLILVISGHMTLSETLSEVTLRRVLGLTGMTTGKGKVNLADSNVRPLEIFGREMGYSEGFKWLSQYIK